MSVVREIKELMGRLARIEQQVAKLPSRIGSGGGAGGGTFRVYEAPSKEELPDGVARTSFGRVTDGPYVGMMCIRNPANDGWDAFNVLE